MSVEVAFKSKIDLKGLAKIAKKESGVKVGILGSKDNRNDGSMGNAEIGVIQEFGSLTNNIPPRSFLRMPLQKKKQQLEDALAGMQKEIVNGEVEKILAKLGLVAENIIGDAFKTKGFGQWAPNKPSTIDRKGSSAPLIDTGQLRRSITSKVIVK